MLKPNSVTIYWYRSFWFYIQIFSQSFIKSADYGTHQGFLKIFLESGARMFKVEVVTLRRWSCLLRWRNHLLWVCCTSQALVDWSWCVLGNVLLGSAILWGWISDLSSQTGWAWLPFVSKLIILTSLLFCFVTWCFLLWSCSNCSFSIEILLFWSGLYGCYFNLFRLFLTLWCYLLLLLNLLRNIYTFFLLGITNTNFFNRCYRCFNFLFFNCFYLFNRVHRRFNLNNFNMSQCGFCNIISSLLDNLVNFTIDLWLFLTLSNLCCIGEGNHSYA